MPNSKDLTGYAWHPEMLKMSENDTKRHRSRCMFYADRKSNYCQKNKNQCFGSSHCEDYCERLKSKEIAQEQLNNGMKTGNVVKQEFHGMRFIKLADIGVYQKERDYQKNAIDTIIRYYISYREMDVPTVVTINNGQFIIIGSAIRYFAAKKIGLEEIPAVMGTDEEIKNWDLLRKKGTLVWNFALKDVGVVIGSTLSTVKIRMDSGKEINYDIFKCLTNKGLKIIK